MLGLWNSIVGFVSIYIWVYIYILYTLKYIPAYVTQIDDGLPLIAELTSIALGLYLPILNEVDDEYVFLQALDG
jgi:hypothetical protein